MKKIGYLVLTLMLCFSFVLAGNDANQQLGVSNGNGNSDSNTNPQYNVSNEDNNSNVIHTLVDVNTSMAQQVTAQRIDRLISAQNRITDINSIKEMRKTLNQDFVLAVQDKNEMAKEQIRAVKVAIARVLGEAVRQNPTINFDDLKGLQQEILISTSEIITDSNNAIQARRTIRATIMNKVLEMRNTGNTVDIVDGNTIAEVPTGTIQIDDNGLFLEGKPIKIIPSRIRAKIAKLERIQLRIDNNIAKYDAEIQNTRNLFGLIPISVTEKASINAETGKIIGYERPFWSIISTGTDAVQENEQIQ